MLRSFIVSSRLAVVIGIFIFVSNCKLPDLVDNSDVPSDILDPHAVQNQAGAIAMYRGAVDAFAYAVGGAAQSISVATPFPAGIPETYVAISGLLTDELGRPALAAVGELGSQLDLRLLDRSRLVNTPSSAFTSIHLVRGRSRIARQYLRTYGTDLPTSLHVHLYAMEGFAAVLLAELWCSGIPLGTLDAGDRFTITRGFRTDEVYDYAIAHFDSAIAVAGDSTRFLHLAKLGRARAFLGKGDVIAAALAAADVPASYRYQFSYVAQYPKFIPDPNYAVRSDKEGTNGLPFISSGDPRTSYPNLMNRTAPLVFATGVEARLLAAEASVIEGRSDWLSILNTLRTTCAVGEPCLSPAPAGVGGIAGLPPISNDPAAGKLTHEDSVNARIDLVFSERAFWLYLTGRRQGDLRRLIRHYGRSEIEVYPVGFWAADALYRYGNAIVVPTPDSERTANPFYEGCDNFDA